MENLKIKAWAEDDRPREKLINKGSSSLSDSELLAILIRIGNKNQSAVELCKQLLNNCDNDLNKLARMSVNEICKLKGIGKVKAVTIMAALELARRRKTSDAVVKKITGSKNIFQLLQPELADKPHEEFWIIYLNQSNKILARESLSKGGVAGTVVDARLVFKRALEHTAVSVILCHNHPSGNIQPSEADIKLTKKLKEAGEMIDIKVLDHIIIAGEAYYSFADEGKM